MKMISRSEFVAILFGTLSVAKFAQEGDVNGKVSATCLKSAENIAVYIDAIPGKKFDPPAQHVSVDQRNLVFIPRTIVTVRGTTVDFLNSDQVTHNVYWPSINGDRKLHHSLAIISPGQKNSLQFSDVGTAQLLCNLHVNMVGYVVVVHTPYFTLTDSDGSFTIKYVPPGNYTLKT